MKLAVKAKRIKVDVNFVTIPRCSVWRILTYSWVNLMVHVGKYS